MANVDVIISKAIITRTFASPIVPGAIEDPALPVNPDGTGNIPPVDGSYADQATMIADQANQLAQYIYYDGTSYWEYLGTTNGNISDYRTILEDGKYILKSQQDFGFFNLVVGSSGSTLSTNVSSAPTESNIIIFRIINTSYSPVRTVFSVSNEGNVAIRTNAGSNVTFFSMKNDAGTNLFTVNGLGGVVHPRSTSATQSVIREELKFNYAQTTSTSGNINNLTLTNAGIKLLVLTGASTLTGVIPRDISNNSILRVYSQGGSRTVSHENVLSDAENRFSLPSASDIIINEDECYTFIYRNSRWRRVF